MWRIVDGGEFEGVVLWGRMRRAAPGHLRQLGISGKSSRSP